MSVSAAEVFRVERDSGTTPMKPTRRGLRALGTAATGFPIPGRRVEFEATLRILDQSGEAVLVKVADSATIDALELEILRDLMRLDEQGFRDLYGLPEGASE